MDKEYEALLENYEDAMMRLVMYRVAQEEGRKLLEETEQLNASGFEVPKEFDERCLKLIRDATASGGQKPVQLLNEAKRGKTRTRSHPRLRMVGRMALATVLAATLMFTVAYAASPEFRAGVLKFFTKVEEIGTYFFFYSDSADSLAPDTSSPLIIKDGMPFEFTYVPDGYELYTREAYDAGAFGTDYFCTFIDPNNDPNNFTFQIGSIDDNMSTLVDTEDAQVTEMKIRGNDGYLVQKMHATTGRNIISYVWFDLDNKLMFQYSSVGISAEESKKIFDAIVIYGQN